MTERRISGYAARYNSITTIGDSFREVLRPGAFARSLRERPDVFMLVAHDWGRVLGRTTAGTLELREDRIGLWFSVVVDESTPDGATALGTVGRGDVASMSFGFGSRDENWVDGGMRLPLRELLDVELFEVSAVARPAYADTSASLARADYNAAASRRRAEAAMRLRGIG